MSRDQRLWVVPPREPHPQFPQLRAGVKDHARCQWEEIPPDGNPPWRAVEERNRVRELYSARPEQGFAIEGPHPCALSLELPGAERSGEGVQTKPQPRLYHSIQPQRSWMPASTGWLLLYCHEGKNPILIRFAPKAHFRNFLWWGRSMHLLDRSWPPVLGSGVRHVLEESFLNFSRVTERFS